MASIPKRVETRLIAGVKKFQPVLTMAKSKDVNESDTVVILNDLLAEIFGYSKYVEIISEFAIRGTYCDLTITLDGKLAVLIEAKRVSPDVKIESDQIRGVIVQEVIKREILESEKFHQAERAIDRAVNKAFRAKKEERGDDASGEAPSIIFAATGRGEPTPINPGGLS